MTSIEYDGPVVHSSHPYKLSLKYVLFLKATDCVSYPRITHIRYGPHSIQYDRQI